MFQIGITGQAGFIGTHLFNTLGLNSEKFVRVPFRDEFFKDKQALQDFVSGCDVIVHLAAVNRHANPDEIYDTNVRLVRELISAMDSTQSRPHVIFASSTQEDRDNPYGRSKREGRQMLADWAKNNGAAFTGLIIPNVFGPFGNPYYNSVIATFSHQLTHGEEPKIDINGHLKLIYIAELVQVIIDICKEKKEDPSLKIPHTMEIDVSEILELLQGYKNQYFMHGNIPSFNNSFEINLFNTFRSYIDPEKHYPVRLAQNTDPRGTFVEIIRPGTGGQVSFSTTKTGITRGNHFHTGKIERFTVIRGSASIQLRRIGTEKVFNFELSGEQPSFVDMPIWYTHNITNTGSDDLYTIFWINEPYNPADPDTYFESV